LAAAISPHACPCEVLQCRKRWEELNGERTELQFSEEKAFPDGTTYKDCWMLTTVSEVLSLAALAGGSRLLYALLNTKFLGKVQAYFHGSWIEKETPTDLYCTKVILGPGALLHYTMDDTLAPVFAFVPPGGRAFLELIFSQINHARSVIAVVGKASIHNNQKSPETFNVPFPLSEKSLLKNWVPKIDCTVSAESQSCEKLNVPQLQLMEGRPES
jgi:hypothetical protein